MISQLPLMQLLQAAELPDAAATDLTPAAEGAEFLALLQALQASGGVLQATAVGQGQPPQMLLGQLLAQDSAGKPLPAGIAGDLTDGKLLPLQQLQQLLVGGDLEAPDERALQRAQLLLQALQAQNGSGTGSAAGAVRDAGNLQQQPQSATTLERPGLPTGMLAWQPGEAGQRALAQQLLTMVQQGPQQMRLQLHPEHLGSIEVRVRLEGDGAQVASVGPKPWEDVSFGG